MKVDILGYKLMRGMSSAVSFSGFHLDESWETIVLTITGRSSTLKTENSLEKEIFFEYTNLARLKIPRQE